MASRDLMNNIAVVQLMKPADINDNDDEATSILDTAGFESAAVIVSLGELTGAASDATMIPVLQHSATTTAGDFTAVDAADIIGAFTIVNSTDKDATCQTVGYKGSKRYLRVVMDFTGTSISAAYVACLGVLGDPHVAPAVAPAAI